jgi:hypothetical protein
LGKQDLAFRLLLFERRNRKLFKILFGDGSLENPGVSTVFLAAQSRAIILSLSGLSHFRLKRGPARPSG